MEQTFAHDVSRDGVRRRGNFVAAFFAGLLAAVVGTALSMCFATDLGKNYYWLALGLGGLTGLAIRFAGHGSSPLYGLLGAVLTLIGIPLTAAYTAIQSATTDKFDFYDVLTRLDWSSFLPSIMRETTSTMYMVYALAVIGAFVLSIQWRVRP